jgi:hypothetical protein
VDRKSPPSKTKGWGTLKYFCVTESERALDGQDADLTTGGEACGKLPVGVPSGLSTISSSLPPNSGESCGRWNLNRQSVVSISKADSNLSPG